MMTVNLIPDMIWMGREADLLLLPNQGADPGPFRRKEKVPNLSPRLLTTPDPRKTLKLKVDLLKSQGVDQYH